MLKLYFTTLVKINLNLILNFNINILFQILKIIVLIIKKVN